MKSKLSERLKKVSKTKIILTTIFVLLCIILIVLTYHRLKLFTQKTSLENSYLSFAEKNQNTIFSIDQIVFFSSSDCKNKVSSKTNFTIENLYSYTDIALFINNNSNENTLENTLKEVYISDIKFTQTPLVGEPKLYYKDLNNFANSTIVDTNLINDNLNFSITSEDNADLSTPVLYNNCANPIVLSYVNENIKTDYTITDTSIPITYNGSLLQRCNVTLDSLKTTIAFNIFITNNNDEKFKTFISLDIPYTNNDESIYNGSLIVKKDTNYLFYRYE